MSTPEGHRPPDHRAPAGEARSVALAAGPIGIGVVLGLVAFTQRTDVTGVFMCLGCWIAAGVVGLQRSNRRSDSRVWQAEEAARRGVATARQRDLLARRRRRP